MDSDVFLEHEGITGIDACISSYTLAHAFMHKESASYITIYIHGNACVSCGNLILTPSKPQWLILAQSAWLLWSSILMARINVNLTRFNCCLSMPIRSVTLLLGIPLLLRYPVRHIVAPGGTIACSGFWSKLIGRGQYLNFSSVRLVYRELQWSFRTIIAWWQIQKIEIEILNCFALLLVHTPAATRTRLNYLGF